MAPSRVTGRNGVAHRRLRLLLATSSVAALLIGGGAPSAAYAACSGYSGPFPNANVGAQTGICINNTAFSGSVGSTGTISPNGVVVTNSTITGGSNALTFSGDVSGGITIDNKSTILADSTAVLISSPTFTGNISNSGTISNGVGGSAVGIIVIDVTTFAGGISNNGTISVGAAGIEVNTTSTFTGNISNSGTISAARYGIVVTDVAAFGSTSAGGGISNSGTISVFNAGIDVGSFGSGVTTFMGGISNVGTISASVAGITVSGVSTFMGNISNSGTISAGTGIVIGSGVTFAAGGAIVNTGTITGTGGTAIDISAATSPVTIDIESGAINGNMLASAGVADTLNFALGAGNTFTYNSDFENFTTVNINSGTVVLNGVNSATSVEVNSGGTLAGTGTVDPLTMTINSGGTLEPGTPGTAGGTLMVDGNLIFDGGSFYSIELSPTQHSFTTVSGTVTINGGTVVLTPHLGNYGATTFAILTSTGTLTGTFDPTITIDGTEKLNGATLTYDTHDVYLSYLATLYTLQLPPGASTNEQNVANVINSFILNGGTAPSGFQTFAGFSGPALLTALNQLDGQDATGAETSTFQLMTDFLNLLSDPSSGGGSSPAGGGAPGFAPEEDASLPTDIAQAYAAMLTKAPPAQQLNFDRRWSAWGAGFGGVGKLDGDPIVGSNGVTASDYGFAAGMDYHATPDSVYGFALAGGGTNWSVAQNLGTGRSDSFLAGVHDTTHWGAFYLSGALAFANHWFTIDRTALGDQLQAKFDGQSYAARGEAGYRYAVPGTGAIIGVTPYAALQVQDFHTPGFSETDLSGGGFGLNFASQNATDTRSELGARFDNVQVVDNMPLVLRARVAWAHDWVSNPSLGAVFQALPGSNFTVNGAAVPQNSALTTAAAELHINANWTAVAKFDGEFAQTAQTYAGTGTLRYSW